MKTYLFNKRVLAFNVTLFVFLFIYIGHLYLSSVLHILPHEGGSVSAPFKVLGLIVPLLYLPMAFRHFRMLFHHGPAVVVDETGIQAFPWNSGKTLRWNEVTRVKFVDWELAFRKGRSYRYVNLYGQDGRLMKIESHVISKSDWEAVYEAIRAKLPPHLSKELATLS